MAKRKNIVIIGAGPAGLAAAWWLVHHSKHAYTITVLEKDTQVGGLAKTLLFKGCRFDLGGHRFYTKIPEVETFYQRVIGNKMQKRNRMSRIYFGGKYYSYPLKIGNVLTQIGILNSVGIVFSYIKRRLNPHIEEKSFKQWVENRFGDELFSIFFKSYTEKVWGIPTSKLSANWAKQRIQNFSLPVAVLNAVFGKVTGNVKTLITEYLYPQKGPGQLYELMTQKIIQKGVVVKLQTKVEGFEMEGKKITGIVTTKLGKKKVYPVDHVITTMPLSDLLKFLSPPQSLRRVVRSLRFRHFLTVNFIVKGSPFPDNWIYIHEPSVSVGRIQNFYNWSPTMSRNNSVSPLSLEYFCDDTDDIWRMTDEKLIALAIEEIKQIRLFDPSIIESSFVYRVKDAYPIYDVDYEKPLAQAKQYISSIVNLSTCGRGGMFRYNNMDHSIESGFMVARNLLHPEITENPWDLKDPIEYLEEKN